MRYPSEDALLSRSGSLAMWAGWLVGPLAWAAHQNISYGVSFWSCSAGITWPLYLVTLVAVLLVVTAGAISWRIRQSASAAERRRATAIRRTRFITTVGVLISALSVLGILVETIPVLFLDACTGAT